MFRKFLIVLAATAALGSGLVATAATAEAHYRHHQSNFSIGLYPFGFYPRYGYYNDRYFGDRQYGYGYRSSYYDDDYDCEYRRVLVKRWNQSHTRLIKVYRKKRVCY